MFLAAYPLNHVFNFSRSAKQYYTQDEDTKEIISGSQRATFLSYLIPSNALFDNLSYSTSTKVVYCLIAFIMIVAGILAALVASRNTKTLSTENPERKLVNKTVGMILSITYYLIFVPVSTFSSRFLVCDKLHEVVYGGCYQGEHLTIFIFVVIALLLHLLLIMYSSAMLTTCYPNENIPWAHFPSKVPFYKLVVRFPIVIVYQLDASIRSSLIYFNATFTLIMSFFVAARLTKATTFDQQIHSINLVSESLLVILFFTAFLTDLIPTIPIDLLFTFVLIFCLLSVAFFLLKV